MRIAVLDHDTHTLYVEDIDDKVLAEKYNGSEQDYINDNYNCKDNCSWDYITDAQYIPKSGDYPIEVDFDELAELV